jgi:hypothetical protein
VLAIPMRGHATVGTAPLMRPGYSVNAVVDVTCGFIEPRSRGRPDVYETGGHHAEEFRG